MRAVILVIVGYSTLVHSATLAFEVTKVVPRNEALMTAARMVDEGEFEEAVATLTQAVEEPELTDDQLAEMYRLMGLSHLYLGNEDLARRAFEKLLQARPDYELPKTAPPKIRSIYSKIKEDIRKRRVRPVTLSLESLGEVPGDEAVTIEAHIEDLTLGARAKLFYRRAGAQSFSSVDLLRSKDDSRRYSSTLPGFEIPAEREGYQMDYYVEVADAAQRRLAGRGDPYSPLTFRVAPQRSVAVGTTQPTPLYRSPWLWIGIGLGVAAASTGIVLLATTPQTASLNVKIQVAGQP